MSRRKPKIDKKTRADIIRAAKALAEDLDVFALIELAGFPAGDHQED